MKLADFKILRVVGEGSYATVYKAIHLPTNQIFALKELDKKQIVRLDKVESVYSERTILNQLSHPNIVKLRATFQSDLFLYFVLEFVEGETLEEYVGKKGQFPLKQVASISQQLLLVLEYLRKEKVVHLDLKPSNILINTNYSDEIEIKIIDFGCSIQIPLLEGVSLANRGTASYSHPLLWTFSNEGGRKCIGYQCDLWSFGCLLYWMLNGNHLIEEKSDYLNMERAISLERREWNVFGGELDEVLFHSDGNWKVGEVMELVAQLIQAR